MKVKHLSKNCATIVEDTDTVLPNVEKNSKITKINHKSTKNQINQFINKWKKTNVHKIKTSIVKIALENHFPIIQIIPEINHLIILVIEAYRQNKEIHGISHKIDIVDQIDKTINIETTIDDQIQTDQNILLIPVPTQTLGINTIQMIDHETHLTIETGIIPKKRNRSYSNSRNQRYQNNRSRDYSNHRSNYQRSNYNNYPNKSRDNSQNRNSNYNNRQRNYPQSPPRNINRYPNSQNKYRSHSPKHQRQINQVQTNEETNSDPQLLIIRKIMNYN